MSGPRPGDVVRRGFTLELDPVAAALLPKLAPETVFALVRHDEDERTRSFAGQRFEIGERLCVSQSGPELVLDEDPDHPVRVTDRHVRVVVPVFFFGQPSVLA